MTHDFCSHLGCECTLKHIVLERMTNRQSADERICRWPLSH